MGNGPKICRSVGLTPTVLRRYAEEVRDRHLSRNQPPLDISPEEMLGHAAAVTNNAEQACANPALAARAAIVVGFATEAAAINSKVPAQVRHRQTLEDYKRFAALVQIGEKDQGRWGKGLNRFRRDVDFITDQDFCFSPTAADSIPEEQPGILADVLEGVKRLRAQGKPSVVVLDLDGTTLRNTDRTLHIMRDFAEENADKLTPAEIATIGSVPPETLFYDFMGDMQIRRNVVSPVFANDFFNYWLRHFFTNQYVVDDTAFPGAPEFARAVVDAGATLVYLTGRQLTGKKPGTEEGMWDGTIASLTKNKFPVPNSKSVRLIMKPDYETKDVVFKEGRLAEIAALGVVVAVFDNEPAIDRMFRKGWPETSVVRVSRCRTSNSTKTMLPSSGEGDPPVLQELERVDDAVVWIQDFRTNGKKLAGK